MVYFFLIYQKGSSSETSSTSELPHHRQNIDSTKSRLHLLHSLIFMMLLLTIYKKPLKRFLYGR
jgi:hypothetical protein